MQTITKFAENKVFLQMLLSLRDRVFSTHAEMGGGRVKLI